MNFRDLNIPCKKQHGAALIAFMLIMITGTSFLLVSKLNANLNQGGNVEETYKSLERAKQSLIGYALTTPERSGAVPRPGPGYLPCPDTDNDGSANTPCGAGSIGRLPYATLEEDVLIDDSGEVLWYALSDNFRFNPALFTPMNSETAGQLTVDGQGDIVAVIIAPGHAFSNQQRSVANINTVASYLENDNSDGDTSFISSLLNDNGLTFNDRVIAITRQELMAAVEKRVLSEVALAFNSYRDELGGLGVGNESLPWLSPFVDPSVSTFVGVPVTSTGHLPIHVAGQNYANQSAPVNVNWINLTGGVFVAAGATPPTEACLRALGCIDPDLGVIAAPIILNNVNCIWSDRLTFNCSGTSQVNGNILSPITIGGFLLGFETRTLMRDYTFNINHIDDGTHIAPSPDTAGQPRTRSLDTAGISQLNNNITNQPVFIQVVDSLDPSVNFLCFIAGVTCAPAGERGRATLGLNDDDTGDIQLTGIDFHMDATGIDQNADGDFVDPGIDANLDLDFFDVGDTPPDVAPELPPWFITNQWHWQVLVAYPASEAVPGIFNAAAPAAGPGVCNGACLTLNATIGANINQVNNNIRALAIVAGQDLDIAVDPRPNADISDYFDIENSDPDEVYDKQVPSLLFNDQSRILLTTTTP